jgi:hypothetical protein
MPTNSTDMKQGLQALREYTDGLLILVGIIFLTVLGYDYFYNGGPLLNVAVTLLGVAIFKLVRISFKLKHLYKD